MKCPRCGFEGSNAVECTRCGVIFAKAGPPTERNTPNYAFPAPSARAPQSSRFPIRTVTLAGLVLLVLWALTRSNPEASSIEGWYDGSSGYDKAIAEQRSTGQPVLLYFYTDWCGYCRRLDRDILSTSDFRSRYPSMLRVKVDAETHRSLAREYDVRAYPTIFVMNAGRNPQRITGYGGRSWFLTQLDHALKRA